jgi:hypothetical protein
METESPSAGKVAPAAFWSWSESSASSESEEHVEWGKESAGDANIVRDYFPKTTDVKNGLDARNAWSGNSLFVRTVQQGHLYMTGASNDRNFLPWSENIVRI